MRLLLVLLLGCAPRVVVSSKPAPEVAVETICAAPCAVNGSKAIGLIANAELHMYQCVCRDGGLQ